ncbi:hypothetical protein Rhe02_82550 [Rhizocola hellebori]|uniref:Sulfotransferase domain-containing protein n=1 Tax=Rhizocola hellebori TaxID=1392758 RepID=A0A8J3QFT6_9ACTN|nr:sulfotransferase domain-containing protein [Rhizocola hellebori]GIH10188.1 hypothetical protein Rhe02_82550 [Rhizocola hellebori]
MLLVYTGRHKAASSWSRYILAEAASALGMRTLTVISPLQWAEHGSLGALIQDKKPDLVSLTNARQEDYDTLPPRRTVNVIRDPRDIVVSGYFSHRNSHVTQALGITWEELIPHRQRLQELDLDEGMLEEIEFSGFFLDHMVTWNYSQPEVLELKMEDLVGDKVRLWTQIFDHYGLLIAPNRVREWVLSAAVKWNLATNKERPMPLRPTTKRALPRIPIKRLPRGYVPRTLEFFTFAKMSNSTRKPGEVDEMSHYRKGIPGDWRNYFTERHAKAFRQRYGDLVERLGYPPE